MKQLIFDLDDTILMQGTYDSYDTIQVNKPLIKLLDEIPTKKYLYTNGTLGHGFNSLKSLQINKMFQDIYARDTLKVMKPSRISFNLVNNLIIHEHNQTNNPGFIFFDDMLSNLRTAKNIGWDTIWIHKDYTNAIYFPFIDRAYPTVEKALHYLQNDGLLKGIEEENEIHL
jgi:FMN phosphatase YigB (HAD superfamily)